MTKVKLVDLVEKDDEGNIITKYKIQPYDAKWIDLKLENGWIIHDQAYNSLQYKKEGNKVYLRGLIRNPNSTNLTIATLPQEIVPKKIYVIPKKVENLQGTTIYIGYQNQLRTDRDYKQDTLVFLDDVMYFID